VLLRLLKDEYLPAIDRLADDESFAAFVALLGETLAQGAHVIWAPPALLDRFAGWPHISRVQADALREMARVVTLRELPFEFVTHALVVTGPAGPTTELPPPIRWQRRPWTWLTARGHLPRTCLGGENVEDAKWFAWLGRAFSARKRPGALNAGAEVSLRTRGLGGSTAAPELEEEVLGETPLLCILDSDRDHPRAAPGDTAKRALKAQDHLIRRGLDPLVHVELLAARDVENLLPRRVVEEIADPGNPWYRPMLARGFFVDDTPRPELRYIDIGKDQCERRLLDTADESTLQYRNAAIAALRVIDPTSPGGTALDPRPSCPRTCGAATGPSKWADMEDNCLLVRSVGKQLLPGVVAHIQAQDAPGKPGSIHWLEERLPNDPALLEPAALAWSWGLSLPRRVRSTPTPL
jgi:hypothetical protein